jgi:hypothetical protein
VKQQTKFLADFMKLALKSKFTEKERESFASDYTRMDIQMKSRVAKMFQDADSKQEFVVEYCRNFDVLTEVI